MIKIHPFRSLTSNLPKLGFCFPAKIFRAVDFPIPLVPTRPKTSPGRGVGNLQGNVNSVKQLLINIHLRELNNPLIY